MLQVTFAEMAQVLEGLDSAVAPAEAHGCLCGALCAREDYPLVLWLEELLAVGQVIDEHSHAVLGTLFEDTLAALRGGDMDFEVLLPRDEIALATRAEVLSQWCQGFLYGFGIASEVDSQQALATNVNEILNDLAHIGRASVELEADDNEEEEAAYAEVVEYVRVGVQLIHDELASQREPMAQGEPQFDDDELPDPSGATLH